jgi:hypothetical protein
LKKIIAVILLLVFLYNVSGYYIWFKLEQYNIKSEIRNNSEIKALTLIIIPLNGKSGLVWTEDNKEFIYHGEMYDVVKVKTGNNSKYYYCINDKKEKQLLTDFIKKDSSQKKSENIIQKVTVNKYQTKPFALIVYNQPITINYCILFNNYTSNISDIHSPPPKSAIS